MRKGFSTGDGQLQITTGDRSFRLYRVTEQELDELCDAGNLKTLAISLFSLVFGTGVSLIATLATVEVLSEAARASFVGGAVACGVLSVLFGIAGVMAWKRAAQRSNHIKASTQFGDGSVV